VSLEGISFTHIGTIDGDVGDMADAGPGAIDAGTSTLDASTLDASTLDAGVGDVRKFEFNLTTYHLHSIRYVRVFDTGGGGLAINAIEGKWSGSP